MAYKLWRLKNFQAIGKEVFSVVEGREWSILSRLHDRDPLPIFREQAGEGQINFNFFYLFFLPSK